MTSTVPPETELLHDYGDSATKIEPGGIERIPVDERHGRPWHLFTTWMSPNLEFATVYVGVIGVLFFGLSFWMTVLAVLVGNVLAGLTHAVVSSWGPRHGLAQMVLSRTAFGYWGNVFPAGLNAVMAGVGWFAVNSISGAYALATLFGLPVKVSLLVVIVLQLVIAFVGHNLIHLFERVAFPVLGIAFLVAAVSTFAHASLSAPAAGGMPTLAAFTVTAAAAFGYTAGWNPYGSDYTRYLPEGDGRQAGVFAGLGDFVSCTVLMVVGAASATIVNTGLAKDASPTDAFTHSMPGWVRAVTLLAIALGAISANVLNIYSGAMSALAMGVRLSLTFRRGIVAVIAGVLGGVVAFRFVGEPDVYENWLLVIAYWIAPWLGVVLTDRLLRRGRPDEEVTELAQDPTHVNWAGPVAMLVAMVLSIWLFSNQVNYTGPIAKVVPDLGDVTPLVGFLLGAGLYAALVPALARRRTAA